MMRIALKIAACVVATAVLSSCAGSPQAKRDKYLANGKRYAEKGDYPRATLEFRNAARAMPNDAESYYQLGLIYDKMRDAQSAVKALRNALALNPKHAGAQLKLAQLMALTNDPALLQEAQRRLQALVNESSTNPEALESLAFTELKLGKIGDAVQNLERSVIQSPRALFVSFVLAKAKLQQNDVAGAEEVLKKVSIESPKSADARRALGEFYVIRGKVREGEAELRAALGLDPKNGPALSELARLELSQGRKQEAEQGFKQLAGLANYRTAYGLFLFQEGRHDEGTREFERVFHENPDDRQARTYLLTAYDEAGRTADVDRVLSEALKKNSRDSDALLQRAEIALERGKYQQAELDLNGVAKLRPTAPEVHYVRAQIDKARGATRSYRQELSEALRLSPILTIRLELAQDLINAHDGKAALDTLDGALPSQKSTIPFLVARNWALGAKDDLAEMRKGIDNGLSLERNADFLLQDGVWKIRAGNPAAARASLEEALKINPSSLLALESLHGTYTGEKNKALAVEMVKEYAARAPKSAAIQYFLGFVLLPNGDVKGARAAFLAAKAADPKFLEADLALVQVDYVEQKFDDARAKLQTFISANPGNQTARRWLGILDEKKGDRAAAVKHFRDALTANPDDSQAANNLAYLLAETSGNLDEALKYAQKAVELAPRQPDYADTLGWILYKKGLYSSAVRYFEQASSNPSNVIWKYHLAMAYAKAGDGRKSRTTLDAALKLNPNVYEAKIAQETVGGSH